MNSDNIILRGTDNEPLVNKDDVLTIEEIDGNFISIYNDFISLSNAEDSTLTFDVDRTYLVGEYTTYDGRMWVATEISTGVTPIEGSADWNDIFPTILAHEKNKDTILDEGGVNETTVAEIRAFIDAGLTSTTNLSLSTKTATSFKIESSTGADVTIPQANNEEAGLLNATDKVKLNNLTGVNTGDQTLVSLNAEDVDNKVTDFTTINNTLYPTTQAVDTYLTAQVPPLVETFIGGIVAQDLQDVTTVGNTTTDNIEFTGSVGVLFDNTSTLRKGTIDAGYGGAKGIAQICSVGYELKWEAGRLYVMGDGGTTIREVSHNFTTTPTTTDDNTKGFIVGSRWILDNGDLYVCTDVTTATAVWVLQTIDASPTDGSTKAVSSNGVFDALALKSNVANPTFTGLTSVDTFKVTTGNYITPVDVVGIASDGGINRISASNGRTALGLGSLATQSGTFSGTSSGTNTGDQIISDATITTTDITTNNFTTAKHGFVPKGTNVGNFLKDDGTWGTPASGSSGGIWGIANSSGVYTYYATWALAVAAATSGKVIELFADITESAVSYTLKNGVNINGNGHTISFSVVDGFVATSSPTICEINNIVVNQATASVSALYINANGSIIGGNATFNSNNASSNGVYGRSVSRIYGFKCNGYNAIYTSNFFSANAIIDNVYVESLGGSITTGTLSNSIIKTSTAGVVPVGDCGTVNNCYIYSNGGSAIVSTGTMEVNNCTIISVTSRAVNGNGITFNNCWIKSSANAVAGNGKFNNCTLISSTTAINTYLGGALFNNCTITANASAVFDSASSSNIVNNCNVICNYNNAGGYGFSGSACYVNNSVIQLSNASSTAFFSSGALTMYLANNSIKGTTNFKNVNVTNGQTNVADLQGNVILQ
jgi:hypothetical protein